MQPLQSSMTARILHGLPGLILGGMMLLLGLVGLLSPAEYNMLPTGPLLEASLLLASLFVLGRCDLAGLLFSLASLAYVGVCALLALKFRDVHPLDFLQAYKAFIYVIPLAFFIGKEVFPRKSLLTLFYLLLGLFLVKYLYSRGLHVTARMGERPGLYAENNFELIFLVLLYYLVFRSLRWPLLVFGVLFFVVFISGSRSAFLGLLVVFAFCFLTRLNLYFIISLFAAPFVLAFGVVMFLQRMKGGLEHVDRYKFTMVFLDEVAEWNWWELFTGAPAITALSPESCKSLAYYYQLFSEWGDGTCYSVILHSYLLRVIFDHGVLGLLFLLVFIWVGLRRSGFAFKDVMCVHGVLLSSALSVSSYNSIFSALILAAFFGAGRLPEPAAEDSAEEMPAQQV